MAFAPVLERPTEVETKRVLTVEEEHNSRISENYAKLINPETRLEEVLGKTAVQPPVSEYAQATYATPAADKTVRTQKLFLVEPARTSAEIFRADSAVNKPVAAAQVQNGEEEDNEDLRPTQTTIQYKTSAVADVTEDGKIENTGAQRHFTISKKEKVLVGLIVSVVVALFTLIIVNAVVISNLNGEMAALDNSLNDAYSVYSEERENFNSYLENVDELVEEYANANNMTRVAE